MKKNKIFKFEFRHFFKDPFNIVSLSLFCAVIVFFIFKEFFSSASTLGVLLDIHKLNNFSMFSFALIAFLSFAWSYKLKSNSIDEYLSSTYDGKKRLLFVQIAVFSVVMLFIFALLLIWSFVIIFKYKAWNLEFVIQTVLGDILNFYLIPLCAVLMGFAFSGVFKRVNGCLFIVLFTLLGGPFMSDLLYTLMETTKINLYPVQRLFDIFPPSLDFTPVPSFGQSILPYRWSIVLFWSFLFILIIILKMEKVNKKKLAYSLISFVISVGCLIGALVPQSKLLLSSDDPVDSIMADVSYYVGEKAEYIDESIDFKISDYKLDITIGNKLSVRATVTVDKQNLKEYDFTLFHGYKVKSVSSDNVDNLDFSQDGDHIKVFNPDNKNIEKITMKYSGYAARYYSNLQGAYLPGTFPFYPYSGMRNSYDVQSQDFAPFTLDEATDFDVTVHSIRNVFTNLSETEKNHFVGKSTGLTILSGIYKEIDIDSMTVVFSPLDRMATEENIKKMVDQNRNTPSLPENIKKIFVVPSINNTSSYTNYHQFSDHLNINSVLYISDMYEYQNVDYRKAGLYNVYSMYLENPDSIRNIIKQRIEHLEPGTKYEDIIPDDANKMLLDYLDRYGEQDGLNRIKQYFDDDNDTRQWIQFIRDELK